MSKKRLDKVSIITTFYNAEKFIENTLRSINSQIVKGFDLEYIIVDDHSPDGSRKIVEKFSAENQLNGDWILVTPKENLGCGGARKYGIEHATGDYFMFVDADDYYIKSDFVKRAYDKIRTSNADIVEYGVLMRQANGKSANLVAPKELHIDNDPHSAMIAIFRDNYIKFNVWSKIYTRDIVMSYPYSTKRTFEDVATIPVWVGNAKHIIIMPTVEINYRAAAQSIIRADINKTRLGTIEAIASHFERWKDDKSVLKYMYSRAMIDLEVMLSNHSSENDGFNEMSALNTKMLKYIYPDTWQTITYNIDEPEEHIEDNKQS